MSAPAWMPFYVADYLADTGHLSTVEHGAYMLLIMHYWQNGGLPTEDLKLARICRLTGKEWQNIKGTLSDLFADDWVHKRIKAELTKAEDITSKRRSAGLASAQHKLNKRSTLVPTELETRAQASPSPTPLPAATQQSRRPDLDRIESEIREASGLENAPSPGLLDLSPILTLLDSGYDLSKDILPKLREAKAKGQAGSSWRYYVPGITEAKAKNGKIPPKPQSQPASIQTKWIPRDSPQWDSVATRYLEEHGKPIPVDRNDGWHVPLEYLEPRPH